ncbi:MAG: histidinol dehydrogenase [Planctomycetes bacterium]|nr:histidinol dehydrogenase [Planctomycetota bacterium]
MAIKVIQSERPLADEAVLALRDRLRAGGLTASGSGELDVPAIVRGIIAEVASGGAGAVADLTRRIDKVDVAPDAVRVPVEKIRQAHAQADPAFLALARRVIANIRQYQQHIKVQAPPDLVRQGRRLGVRYTPVDRVGLYVPGGKAIYPSSVLMTIIPAQVAGVRQIAIAAPPTETGVNPMTMALAGELGIEEVYRVGGAIAMAALALGTDRIAPVQMLAGPGNAFVAEAKKQLFGRVAIDSLAGPSEVLVIADETAVAAHVAADLLAQAEHNPGSAILVTPSMALAARVADELEIQLEGLERAEALRAAIDRYSAIIVVPSIDAACDVANALATEHLQIITGDDEAAAAKIRHAGAIFLGDATPVPVGDYYAGPSHVLPTGGTARFFSALSANSFLKATSILRYDRAALAADGGDIIDFATREGLTAHAAAVRRRKGREA